MIPNFPPPSPKQAQILWFSLTALAIGICLLLIGLVFWGLGVVIEKLTPVLIPLAVAGVIACILSPVVDFLEKKRMKRPTAIVLVFIIAVVMVLLVSATVVPRLVKEAEALVQKIPEILQTVPQRLDELAKKTPFARVMFPDPAPSATPSGELVEKKIAAPPASPADPAPDAPTVIEPAAPAGTIWQTEAGAELLAWIQGALPEIGRWLLAQLKRLASFFGLVAGLALIPVYVFYFLLEKKPIEKNWTLYLPVRESWAKDELVFILKQINERLVTFFRGQVLVAMCVGTLLTIGFLVLGLNYAVLLGVIAGFFGIIPYLGVLLSLAPAVLIAIAQFGDWWHPLIVLGIFGLVQFLEGFVISPKIIGDRVGLHPLTIIIAVMVGTTLMGGIIGGVLAIPLTAVIRELMFRYVWKKREKGPRDHPALRA